MIQSPEKKSRVVAAVIKRGDKYLCMQRCRSKYDYISERWEFPGGKVEEGEDDREALKREIKEEMDWDINVEELISIIDYDYPDFSVTIAAYLRHGTDHDDSKLLEHLKYRWLTRKELPLLEWTAADAELIKAL